MLEWLNTPFDPSRLHIIAQPQAWHGRAMVFAWGVLLPLGIMLARFYKITPRQRWPEVLDNKAWWHGHLSLQYFGAAATGFGVGMVWPSREAVPGAQIHALLGWSVLALLGVQLLGGWLRGSKGGPRDPRPDGALEGDHFSMTLRRRVFERVHKACGYVALLIAAGAIVSGLYHVNAPRWIWISLAVWWLLLFAAGMRLQRQGRAVDTYQAIWGPDPSLPGNRVPPIGWGVRRLGVGGGHNPDHHA